MVTRRQLIAGASGLLAAGAGVATGCSSSSAGSHAKEHDPAPPHLTAVTALVESLRHVPWSERRNRYKKVDEDDGRITTVVWEGRTEVLAQCGSFQALVLEHAYGRGGRHTWATGAFFRERFFSDRGRRDRHKRFPNAAEFREGFVTGAGAPYLERVDGPGALRPGDLVAIDYRDRNRWYSGHIVMIRANRGTLRSPVDRRLSGDVVGHVFEIIDCTDAPHGDPERGTLSLYRRFPDTRISYRGSGHGAEDVRSHTGAGFGHMVFYADASGAFAGYRWSVNDGKPNPARRRLIAAARVAPEHN